MTNDTDAILDDILARWAWWLRPVHVGTGYQHQSAGCGQYRTSRQYDDANGALDDDQEHQKMKRVNEQVESLPNEPTRPYRIAIYAEGRRLVVGGSIAINPRLPADINERRAVIAQARSMLMARLTKAEIV